jgi:hypothetical protein
MAFFNESRDQIVAMLNGMNFQSAFPAVYAGTKAVTITEAWPVDLIQNMIAETGQGMTMPIVSVMLADANDTFRSMGGVFGSGPTSAYNATYATRVEAAYLLAVWADQTMGGADMVEKVAGLIQAWAFVNREALSAFRHLRCRASHPAYQMAAQLWRFDITLEGDALVSYYA